MEHILTDEMLLQNTRSVAQFAPSMLISLSICLDVHVSIGDVRPLDGLVGAVILGGKYFITSANANYIPLPPFGDHQVKLHADSRYGDDDPTQWPQPYNAYHTHMAGIPRPNMLLNHQIIWWTPTPGDFSCPPLNGPVSGLGKLCQI